MFFAIALLSGALSLQQPQQGGVTVRGELSARSTSVGQPVVFTVTVRTKSALDPLIEMPPLPQGLQLAGTSSSNELEIAMPGGRTNIVRQEYQLVPTRPGNYTIVPATVRLGSQVYHTQPLALAVGGSAAAPSASDGSPVQLAISAEPRTPYVGQQILLKLEALLPTDGQFQPLRPPSYDPPSPSGFWIQNLPDPVSSELRIIDGRQYEVQTYQRAYFPLTPGKFTIPPGRFIYDVRGGVFFAPETREIVSDSLSINVRRVPDAGKPASFGGAVGAFKIFAGVSHAEIAVGDALTYSLQIEGTGNLKSIPPPPFPGTANVDIYPPSEDATLKIVNGIVGGTRTFEWVLIPRKAGTIEIPPVAFSWFDPATERYETASTAPVRVTVTPAAAIATSGGDTTLAPLRTRRGSGITSFARTRAFALLQLIPLAALLLLLAVRERRKRSGSGPAAERAVFARRLAELDALAQQDVREFYGLAVRIADDARSASAETPTRERGTALITQLRSALYAPDVPTAEMRNAAARDVRAYVDTVMDERRRRRPTAESKRGSGSVASIALVAAAAMFLAPALARGGTRTLFERGVQDFANGKYAEASGNFARQVRVDRYDAGAWYNLGNAYYRNADPGRAVWAWLHALELQPRSRDVMHNLNLLNARRAAAEVEHWFPISDAELAWLAALCWWLCIACTIAHLLRRSAARNLSTLAALSFGTATAAALIMMAARWVGPDAVVPTGHGTAMYAAPTGRTEVRDHLEVGDAAEILRREGNWILVRTSSFAEGWVQAASVLLL